MPVVDLVYPPRCPLCGTALATQGGLCSDCWSDLEVPAEAVGEEPEVIAASVYNDASRKLLLAFKHGGKIALAPLLAGLIATRMPEAAAGAQVPLLVPVPLHRWRLWGRGYNQAALLARELERRGKGELLVDGLVRRKRTPSLGGLGGEERMKVLAGAIVASRSASHRINGRDVILVDDVFTSGATSGACKQALTDAGAKSVNIACFARVMDSSRF